MKREFYRLCQRTQARRTIRHREDQYEKQRVFNTYNGLLSLAINFAVPVVGLLPMSWQIYLRDQVALLQRLDPKSAVSASAIYVLAFSVLGLIEIYTGTLLANGISITYPFPQKEFGQEVIRQLPLIELGPGSTRVLILCLFLDSLLRLYFNHAKNRMLGLFGSLGAVLSAFFRAFGLTSNDVALREQVLLDIEFNVDAASTQMESAHRAEVSFARFLNRRGADQ